MSQLLVSVRDGAEATAALRGGADLIDVKDPAAGPLGRASPAALREVLAAVAGRKPVSASLGELIEWADRDAGEWPLPEGVALVKVGLAACRLRRRDWHAILRAVRVRIESHAMAPLNLPGWVACAYADAAWAQSPPPLEVIKVAAGEGFAGVLLDTWEKNGNRLADWMTDDELAGFVSAARGAGLSVAIAGSLTRDDIERLRPLEPDWFAVRGAACVRGRDSAIDAEAVAALAGVIRFPNNGPTDRAGT